MVRVTVMHKDVVRLKVRVSPRQGQGDGCPPPLHLTHVEGHGQGSSPHCLLEVL